MRVCINVSVGEDEAGKSTNMVPISSIEIRGLGVLCVFEAKLCGCAEEQTEANDRHTSHGDFGRQPAVH